MTARTDSWQAIVLDDAEAGGPVLGGARGPAGRDPAQLLADIRRYLGMDVALVCELRGSRQLCRLVDGDGDSFGIRAGESMQGAEGFYGGLAAGALPAFSGDVRNDPRLDDLDALRKADIAAYAGVPLMFSGGTPYGVLCCLRHEPDPLLDGRDVEIVRFLSQFVAGELELQRLEVTNRKLQLKADSIRAFMAELEARDGYAGRHIESVVDLARSVSAELGLSRQGACQVEQLALFHDVGKIGVPASILRKGTYLDAREWRVVRQYPVVGAHIVSAVPELCHLAPGVRAVHERWDGQGYPDGLREESIPLPSRIVFACDSYDAMVSARPYREGIDAGEATRELAACAGSQFCPQIIEALLSVVEREDLPERSHPEARP